MTAGRHEGAGSHTHDGQGEQGIGEIVARRTIRPNEVDLFMFSAATWLTHRIHFDRDYARVEGFADLVVHGPLQGAYLAQMLSEVARRQGGGLVQLSYRHHKPVYCGDLLVLTAVATAVVEQDPGVALHVAVEIANGDGVEVTSGNAVVGLPDQRAVARLRDEAEVRSDPWPASRVKE